jgi:hypothetical protein
MVRRSAWVILAFSVCTAWWGLSPGEAAQVSAPVVTVGVGDAFSIPISVADVPDLTSWQFDLSFAPDIVTATSITEGPFLSSFGTTLFVPGVIDNTSGLISLTSDFFVDLPPDPAGDGILASIGFTAHAAGVSPLTFSGTFLNLLDVGFDVVNGQITVRGDQGGGGGGTATVPAPATVALVASAIGFLALARRQSSAIRGVAAVFVLVAAVVVGCLASPGEAQTVSPGPYYAPPSWDQTLPAATRFVVLSNMSNAAVLDRETGLVWERSPLSPCTNPLFCITLESGVRTYDRAHFHCRQLTLGHRGGWRLPTVEELASLLDLDPANTSVSRLPPGHPFQGVQFSYWTGTTVDQVDADGHALPIAVYTMSFLSAGVGEAAKLVSTVQEGVWCVRGGRGVDPQ